MVSLKTIIVGLSSLAPSLINFFAVAFIAKLYLPEVFGIYFFILSIATLATMIATGMFHHGIISESIRKNAIILFFHCHILNISACIFFYIFGEIFLNLNKIESSEWAYGCILTFFLGGAQISLNLLIRFKRYYTYSSILIARAIFLNLLQILMAGTGYNSWMSLCLAATLSELLVILGVFGGFRLARLMGFFSWKAGCAQVAKNHKFFKYYLPSQFLGVGVNYLPLYLMRIIGESVGMGYYAMSIRLVGTPINAISNSVRVVFWRSVADLDPRQIFKKTIVTWFFILISGIFISIIFYYFNIPLSQLVLGDKWTRLDKLMPFLILWQLSSLGGVFISEFLKNTQQQAGVLLYEIISGSIKMVSLLLLIFFNSMNFILEGFFIAAFFGNVVAAIFSMINIKKH